MEQKMWLETAVYPVCLEPSCLFPTAGLGWEHLRGVQGRREQAGYFCLLAMNVD